MSPRPRTRSDEEILEAALRVMRAVGPVRLTLAAVAGEVGLSPAALVQRFGDKRALVLAAARRAAVRAGSDFLERSRDSGSPVAALIELLSAGAGEGGGLPDHFLLLQLDLHDPELRVVARTFAQRRRQGMAALIEAAVERGDLVETSAGDLARSLEAACVGAFAVWALWPQATAEEVVRGEVERLLDSFRPAGLPDP